MEMGLVCLLLDKNYSFKTITKTRFNKLSNDEQINCLINIYKYNLNNLINILDYCYIKDIYSYRLSSDMFPFGDTPIGKDIIDLFKHDFDSIRLRVLNYNIRLTYHPPVFVSLNSEKVDVIKNSITILEHHSHIMDLLNLDVSPLNLINIHVKNKDRINEFVSVVNDLDINIKNRLTLENDEYIFSVYDLLSIYEKTNIPIVFDIHHALVMHKLNTYSHKDLYHQFLLAKDTWENNNIQLCHLSNGKSFFNDRSHSDYIVNYPDFIEEIPYLDIEAKCKNESIFKLRELLYG